MSTAHEHEIGFVSFVVKTRRERVEALLGSRRRRSELLSELPHFRDWDPRVIAPLPPSCGQASDIIRELRARRAPGEAYVISLSPDVDGRVMSLADAVNAVVQSRPSGGVVLSCIPGRLAYWESEHPGAGHGRSDCFVLQRVA